MPVMTGKKLQSLWDLAREQHWVITRRQLLDAGLSRHAISHRLAEGRMFPLYAGVYAVGHPEPSRCGWWLAAVLACGRGAVLSFSSAAVLMRIVRSERELSVSVPEGRRIVRPGVRVYPTRLLPGDTSVVDRIPVTSPTRTLIDLATELEITPLEAAVNEAAVRRLVQPDALRRELGLRPGQRGVRPLRELLDRHAFRMTQSELERWFLSVARAAELPVPQTQVWVEGFRVDFAWPSLRLVVETDGGRFHRTAMQQTRDRRREHALDRAGWHLIRFTHHQVRHEHAYVRATLEDVSRRLRSRAV